MRSAVRDLKAYIEENTHRSKTLTTRKNKLCSNQDPEMNRKTVGMHLVALPVNRVRVAQRIGAQLRRKRNRESERNCYLWHQQKFKIYR